MCDAALRDFNNGFFHMDFRNLVTVNSLGWICIINSRYFIELEGRKFTFNFYVTFIRKYVRVVYVRISENNIVTVLTNVEHYIP